MAGRSDWVARLDFDWAIRLTRHLRSTQAVLPFGSWWEAPITSTIVSGVPTQLAGICHGLTISMIFPWLREWCLKVSVDLTKTLHSDESGWSDPLVGLGTLDGFI